MKKISLKTVIKIVVVISVSFIITTILAIFDLHYLGDKSRWSSVDRIRIKIYLEVVSLCGFIVPPIGPLDLIHHGAMLGDAYIDKNLPSMGTMKFLRQFVIDSSNNIKETKIGSFCYNLLQHE